MPSIRVTATLGEDDLLDAAARAAEALHLPIEDEEDDAIYVRKGNLLASILVGGLVVYASFKVYTFKTKAGNGSVTLEWDTPWWGGLLGGWRSKAFARTFADEVEGQIEDAGGEVLNRKES